MQPQNSYEAERSNIDESEVPIQISSDDSVDSRSTPAKKPTLLCSTPKNKRVASKPHLFRISSAWRPNYCAICSSMIGWRLKGYQCEECKLDCCVDCQLIVDKELPCGSHAAAMAVKEALHSKLTVSNVFSVLAPVKEISFDGNKGGGDSVTDESRWTRKDTQVIVDKRTSGVGSFQFRIFKACLFQNPFPSEAELGFILKNSDQGLRSGDYYTRVSWTDGKETKRTKTVFQTAKPRFDSAEMSIKA